MQSTNLNNFKTPNFISFVSTSKDGDMTSEENLKKFLNKLKITNYILGEQVHKDKVAIIKTSKQKMILGVDGLITNKHNISLLIKSADCVPIILFDPVRKVLAAMHAGWRGTNLKISQKVIKIMEDKFRSVPRNILAYIGPSIDKDNYIVKKDVANKFENYSDSLENVDDTFWKLNLVDINRRQLIELGVNKDNIKMAGASTFKSKEFFSYRKNGTSKRFITGGVMI